MKKIHLKSILAAIVMVVFFQMSVARADVPALTVDGNRVLSGGEVKSFAGNSFFGVPLAGVRKTCTTRALSVGVTWIGIIKPYAERLNKRNLLHWPWQTNCSWHAELVSICRWSVWRSDHQFKKHSLCFVFLCRIAWTETTRQS